MEGNLMPCFNLTEICKFIEYSDNNKVKETEIIVNTDSSFDSLTPEPSGQTISNKSVRDSFISANSQVDNIRYDLIKTLILKVIDDESYLKDEKDGETYFSMGTQIALNTLIEYNMIKK
jgi:hypothetical protein